MKKITSFFVIVIMAACCYQAGAATKKESSSGKSADSPKLQPSVKYPGVTVWPLKEEYKYSLEYNPFGVGYKTTAQSEKMNYRSLYYNFAEAAKDDVVPVCVWGLKKEYKNDSIKYEDYLCNLDGDAPGRK